MPKIVKKREKRSADSQMFSGDELDIKAFWEKKGQFFHHIIMIFGSKSEKFRGEFRDFFLVSAEISALRAEKQHLLKFFTKLFC